MGITDYKQMAILHNQMTELMNSTKREDSDIDINEYINHLNNMKVPDINKMISSYSLGELYNTINSARLKSNNKKKFDAMDNIMLNNGFKPLASGTNRRTYFHILNDSIVMKIAIDDQGMKDNLNEFSRQHLLFPFFARMFEVTNDGLASISERVETMTEKDFKTKYLDDVYSIIEMLYRRGLVMEDIGMNFFKNWGIRGKDEPVILDCPYIYQVYGALLCKRKHHISNEICGGEIKYDYKKGCSQLVCTKCGTRYSAEQIGKFYS